MWLVVVISCVMVVVVSSEVVLLLVVGCVFCIILVSRFMKFLFYWVVIFVL